jgi:hypothetical protein
MCGECVPTGRALCSPYGMFCALVTKMTDGVLPCQCGYQRKKVMQKEQPQNVDVVELELEQDDVNITTAKEQSRVFQEEIKNENKEKSIANIDSDVHITSITRKTRETKSKRVKVVRKKANNTKSIVKNKKSRAIL